MFRSLHRQAKSKKATKDLPRQCSSVAFMRAENLLNSSPEKSMQRFPLFCKGERIASVSIIVAALVFRRDPESPIGYHPLLLCRQRVDRGSSRTAQKNLYRSLESHAVIASQTCVANGFNWGKCKNSTVGKTAESSRFALRNERLSLILGASRWGDSR
jgi:hypothetical protein